MEKLYTIALVGRPNVGKSSLFNALLGYRRAIVLDMPGTTRDDVLETCDWDGKKLRFLDSQGIWDESDGAVLERVIGKSDAILFVVDGAVGTTPFERWIAMYVERSKKPVLLVANKSDISGSITAEEFAELGFKDSVSVSVAHRRGMDLVKEWCLDKGQPIAGDDEEDPLTLALIGRPNAGKSTMMNRLCGEAVSLVSPVPHTTRDPIHFDLETQSGKIRLVDTAGIRRPRSEKEDVEVFSIQASTRAIHSADVVFLLVNCNEPMTDQDMRLLNLIEREGKPAAVLLNFWDCVEKPSVAEFLLDSGFGNHLKNFKTFPVSGLTGLNVSRCLPLAFSLFRNAKRRVKTAKLNRFVQALIDKNPPPTRGRHSFNFLYASQVRTEPPTFVFFLNRRERLPDSYQKYVENSLRQVLRLQGQTIRVLFRAKEGRE